MENRQRYIAELVGALVLVFASGAAIVTSGGDPVVTAAAVGAAFAGMWWVFGDRAVTHFNPALAIASVAARRSAAKDLLPTIAAQMVGALVAGALLFAVFDGRPFGTGAGGLAASAPTLAGWSVLSIIVLELLVTATFALAWLKLTERPSDAPTKGLALGALYGGASLATLGLTWSALNPLRTLGPVLFAGTSVAALAVFWIAALAGGALAAGVYIAVSEPGRWAQLTGTTQA